MAEVRVKKWGNSIGVIIPSEIAKLENIKDGDTIKLDVLKKKIFDGFGMLKDLPPFKEEKEPHEEFW